MGCFCAVNKVGVTLLEIIVAVGILAMAMIPIAGVMGHGGKAVIKDAHNIEAIQLLEKTVNLLLQQPYKDIPLGSNIQSYSTPTVQLGSVTGKRGTPYTVSLNCTAVPVSFSFYSVKVDDLTFSESNPPANLFIGPQTLSLSDCLKKILVKVQWVEQNTLTVEIKAITYRSDLNRRGS